MYGLGGIVGSLLGGYLTENEQERWCFALRAFLGFTISGVAMMIDKSLENDPSELINASVMARTKSNMKDICHGLKEPALYRSIIFFIILGAVIP